MGRIYFPGLKQKRSLYLQDLDSSGLQNGIFSIKIAIEVLSFLKKQNIFLDVKYYEI